MFSACSGAAYQVNERAYVQIFGVNKTDEVFNVFIQSISDGETSVINGSGISVNAAIADAELRAGKKLFLGHMKLFIIGDGFDNIAKELEVFLSGDICPACPVAYSEDPGGVAALGEGEDGQSADELLKIITVYSEQGKSVITPLTTVASGTTENYTAAPIPIIAAGYNGLFVGGVTFAEKNGVSGFLSGEDVFGLELLGGKFPDGGKVTVVTDVEGQTAAADILNAKIKKSVEIKDGKVYVNIDITLKTDITENANSIPDNIIENEVRHYVSDTVYTAFNASVWETEHDTVGIAKMLRKHDSEAYQNFLANPRETLSNTVLNVMVR